MERRSGKEGFGMAMLCVIVWLFPGLAPLWMLPPDGVWQETTNQVSQGERKESLLSLRKTARRIRGPCFKGIWKNDGVRLEGG